AIDLDPKVALAHYNLGLALYRKGRVDEAVAAYRQAIDLDPKQALAHNNLGIALYSKGLLTEAIDCFHKAIELDRTYAQAHGVLGMALLKQGRFAEAKAATRRGLDLLPENHPLRQRFALQLEQCKRLLALDDKLPVILKGEAEPADAAERIDL